MRSALLGTALLASVLAACTRPGASVATPPAPAVPAPHSPAEEAARWAQANALRQQILDLTTWVEPEKAPCDPGALRTFGTDSVRGFKQADSVIRQLEKTIVTMGIDESPNSKQAHALLRTLLEWEAGSARPSWDVPAGTKPKRAVSAGLTGDFFNEDTKKCEALSARDTVILVAPEVIRFEAPKRLRTAHAEVVYGEAGLKGARDRFYTATKGDTAATFMYTRLTAMVTWRDFAVTAVNRPLEKQAVMKLQRGAGGATYLWHRVGDEWRLLAIARTWD